MGVQGNKQYRAGGQKILLCLNWAIASEAEVVKLWGWVNDIEILAARIKSPEEAAASLQAGADHLTAKVRYYSGFASAV